MLQRDEIMDFFKLQRSHAKKELGQNFLCNQVIINNIIDLLKIDPKDKILEIGPGLGALTNEIVDKSQKYTVCEYDPKFVEYLEKAYGQTNIQINKGNFLKFNDFDFDKVIGNLPYYITSEILLYIALNFKNLKLGVFMIQKEAFNRIVAKKGDSDYNVLNILLDYLFNIEKKFIVGASNFFPMPNVNSIVFTITPKEIDRNIVLPLYKTIKIMFNNRRKTIFNNLNALVNNKETTTLIINKLKLNVNERPENLDLNNFLDLTNILLNMKIIKL